MGTRASCTHTSDSSILAVSFYSHEIITLTVGRPAPQTCQPRFGNLATLNTPPASVHSPLRQMNVESDNETHCSFVLKKPKNTDQVITDVTIYKNTGLSNVWRSR